MWNMLSAAEKKIPPQTGVQAHAAVTVIREAGGMYGRQRYPLILYLKSRYPFRGYFLSPALEGETRVCFGSYGEFIRRAGELTERVRDLFRSGKSLDTEHWRPRPAVHRRADRVLLIRPGENGEWSGDVYTPGSMTLETFRGRAELEKLLCL